MPSFMRSSSPSPRRTGQSQRFVLERALEHYLHNVVPSQRMVRPEVMAAYRRSNEKYREFIRSWLSERPNAST